VSVKGALDAAWHRTHRMPKNPTRDERMAWHVAHAAACGCRPIPASLKAAIGQWRRAKLAHRKAR